MSKLMKEYTMKNIVEYTDDIPDDELMDGAKIYERFCIRPLSQAGKIVPLRLRINKRLSGWKLKDELVNSLGLIPGDTINTEVTVYFETGLVDDGNDMDLFAGGEAADWLYDSCEEKGTAEGLVIDCFVKLSYSEAPVGQNNKKVWKASLILLQGIKVVEIDRTAMGNDSDSELSGELLSLLRNL